MQTYIIKYRIKSFRCQTKCYIAKLIKTFQRDYTSIYFSWLLFFLSLQECIMQRQNFNKMLSHRISDEISDFCSAYFSSLTVHWCKSIVASLKGMNRKINIDSSTFFHLKCICISEYVLKCICTNKKKILLF